MTDTPLDPRYARLVALLYDELSPAEARALHDELLRDAQLRAEWKELQAARSLVRTWDVEESCPSFAFLEPPAQAADPGLDAMPALQANPGLTAPGPKVPGLRAVPGGVSGAGRPGPGRLVAYSGWGLAAAAFLILGLAGKGLRLERFPDGFAFGVGRSALEDGAGGLASSHRRANDGAVRTGGGALPGGRLALSASPFGYHPGVGVQNVAAGGDSYVTGRALDAHTEQLLELIGRVVSEERIRQQRDFAEMIRTAYGDLNDRQFAGYRDLRNRIDAVNVGLKLGQSGLIRNADGTTTPAIVDTLEVTKSRPGRLGRELKRGWRLGDFPNEPERP